MFEWDEPKRESNIEKHGLDFVSAALLFDGRPVLTVPASHAAEQRFLSVASVGDVFVTAVWTWRGANRRIISFRRARHEERRAFERLLG